MDDITCPRCKTSKLRNPSLKLLVNTCGHPLCEACVDLIFGSRASGHCPECHIALKRSLYRLQVFENSLIEREIEIRKRLSREVFNKTEEDFASIKEYNDYLEFIEDIVFELLDSGKNGPETLNESAKKKIEQYKKENRDHIGKNKGKTTKDQEELERIIEQERMEAHAINYGDTHNSNTNVDNDITHKIPENTSQIKKIKTHHPNVNDLILNELANSDMPAEMVIKSVQLRISKQLENDMSSEHPGIDISVEGAHGDTLIKKIGSQNGSLLTFAHDLDHIPEVTYNFPVINRYHVKESDEKPEPYQYEAPKMDFFDGPEPPSLASLKTLGYLYNIRAANEVERAGGYTESLPCYRALQEAFCGLFYAPTL